MKTTKKQAAKLPLMESFANTCSAFQAQMREIAAAGGHTIEYVFGLWDDYCATGKDQSKAVCEFVRWYADELKPSATPEPASGCARMPANELSAQSGDNGAETTPDSINAHAAEVATWVDATTDYSSTATASHTPAPWRNDMHFRGMRPADRALCMAAPELLAALKRLLDHTLRANKDYEATATAKAAISAAEGRTQ